MTNICKICGSAESKVVVNLELFQLHRCYYCTALYRVDKAKTGDFAIEGADVNLDNVWQEYENLYYPGRAKTYDKVLSLLGNGDNKRLLDIGSALGWFMEKAAHKRYQVWGIEPSTQVAHIGQERTKRPVEIATVENIPHESDFFQVLSLFDVMEHTEDPVASMKEISRVLSDGGMLVLRVPDTGGLLPRISHMLYKISLGRFTKPIILLYRFHRWGFNCKSLEFLVNNAGFKIIHQYCEDAQDISAMRHKTWAKNPIVFYGVYGVILLSRMLGLRDERVIIARKNVSIRSAPLLTV